MFTLYRHPAMSTITEVKHTYQNPESGAIFKCCERRDKGFDACPGCPRTNEMLDKIIFRINEILHHPYYITQPDIPKHRNLYHPRQSSYPPEQEGLY